MGEPDTRAHRFLLCWAAVYLGFFSAAQTKLPNYIAPLYPAVALLTARFLVRWRDGVLFPARWVVPAGAAGLALAGALSAAGLLVAGGTIPLLTNGRVFPGLGPWAAAGLIPVAGAVVMAISLRRGDRPAVVAALSLASVSWVGLLAAGPPAVVDRYKAAKELVRASGAHQPDRDIRLAAVGYFQESVVFYAERRVERLFTAEQAVAFLSLPRPGYLFVPAKEWAEQVAGRVTVPTRVAARRYDFYRNADVLVVTNE